MSYDPYDDHRWEEPWTVWCAECSADITGHPDNGWVHEVTCSRHPDFRPDLEDVPHPAAELEPVALKPGA